MKRCRKCNFQSDAMLEYCWQCGVPLTDASNAGQFYQGAQPTQKSYSLPNQAQGFSTYGQEAGAPGYQPRPASYSFGRVAAVLGGMLFFLLLISGAGAMVVYKLVSKQQTDCCAPNPEYRYRNPKPAKSPAVRENPITERTRTNKPSTRFEKIWVDYNVKENGRLGMRIHVKFSVFNMKGIDSRLAVYFEKADGTKLRTTNKKFAGKNGEVTVSRALKPGFDDTVYKDLEVFMPYEELKLGRGKYDLKMDAKLTYENGELVEHLGYHDFMYEKK